MKKNLLCVVAACLCAFLCLFGAMQWTLHVKDGAVDEAYRTAQETLRATELTQSITRLEFGIRYGKTLENYYNMDSVLQSILRSSAYVEGVYVLDVSDRLLYSAGEPLSDAGQIQVLHNPDSLYVSSEHGDHAYMFMDIASADGGTAGTLMVRLNNDIMNRLIASYQNESRVQSYVILGEALLLFLLLFLRMGRKQKKQLLAGSAAVLLSATVMLAQCADVTVESVKLSAKINTITSQSVQKIAQVLQQQVDDVLGKGVSTDELYDIYGWLDDIGTQLDSVESLDFTAEGKVRATMNPQALQTRILYSIGGMLLMLLEQAAACAALCLFVRWLQQTVQRRRRTPAQTVQSA